MPKVCNNLTERLQISVQHTEINTYTVSRKTCNPIFVYNFDKSRAISKILLLLNPTQSERLFSTDQKLGYILTSTVICLKTDHELTKYRIISRYLRTSYRYSVSISKISDINLSLVITEMDAQ